MNVIAKELDWKIVRATNDALTICLSFILGTARLLNDFLKILADTRLYESA